MIKTDDIYIKQLHQVPDIEFFNKEIECDEQKVCLFEGGETKALELCKKRVDYETESFKNGKMNPNLKKPIIFTTEVSLSPYLRFGCLSIRKLYWDIKNCYEKVNKKNFSLTLTFYYKAMCFLNLFKNYNGAIGSFNPNEQLFWREYFYQMSFKNEKFHQVDGK